MKTKPITVHCNLWECTKWFRHGGRTIRVRFLSDARDYLARHGRMLVVTFR